MAFDFKVNGKAAHSDAPPNTPLLMPAPCNLGVHAA